MVVLVMVFVVFVEMVEAGSSRWTCKQARTRLKIYTVASLKEGKKKRA